MLTGDKKETAINIGYSCSLLQDNMEVLQCDAESEKEVEAWATAKIAEYKNSAAPLALVIDGRTLTYVESESCVPPTNLLATSYPNPL